MSLQPFSPRANGSVVRGLMPELWGNSLQAYASNDPAFGTRVRLIPANFSPLGLTGTTGVTNEGGWSAQDSVTAGGTYAVTDAGIKGGQLLVASDGTTADYGVELFSSVRSLVTPMHATLPSVRTIVQFEIDPVAVNGQQLYLLSSTTDPVVGANDAIADHGYVGFQVDEDGDLNFVCSSATGGTTDSIEVIENADFVQLDPHQIGFAINQDGSVEIVVDNTRYPAKAATINSAALPTGVLNVRVGCSSSGTTAGSIRVGPIDAFAEQAN